MSGALCVADHETVDDPVALMGSWIAVAVVAATATSDYAGFLHCHCGSDDCPSSRTVLLTLNAKGGARE